MLNWAPATETIEQVVLGMGRDAAPFMQQLAAPEKDGEVLVIEVDGKCPPTATEEELAKRRGKRKPKHAKQCQCGCQRHRGKAKRQARGSKKRRKRGDKSKNGKEVIVVVMYTLQTGERRQTAWSDQQEIVRYVCRQKGGGGVGAGGSDQAWLRAGHDQDRANRRGWRQGVAKNNGSQVSQGDLHTGCVSRGGEVVGVGPSLPQRRK